MPQVFISYSRKDLAFVEQLAADLKEAGLDVWYDLSRLEGGDRWSRAIEQAIRDSQYMIVVLSPDSNESEWVEKEFIFASSLKRKIIPLFYRSCDLRLTYINLHYVDVQGGKYKQNFNQILRALNVQSRPAQVVTPHSITLPRSSTSLKANNESGSWDIKCPACGELNPFELEFCRNCQTRLRQGDTGNLRLASGPIQLDQTSTKKSTAELEPNLLQWSRGARNEAREGAKAETEQAAHNESGSWDIKCPACGELNPSELEFCRNCQTRLRQSDTGNLRLASGSIQLDQTSTKKSTAELEPNLLQWLRGARNEAREGAKAEAEQIAQNVQRPVRPTNQVPNLLTGLQSESADEDGPDWLAVITGAVPKSKKADMLKNSQSSSLTYENKIALSNGMEFMRVPAGKFLMGSTKENKLADDEERPQHTVDIPYDYWMARFPVTNEQYSLYAKAKSIQHPVDSWEKKKDHPVGTVSWNDAMAYCGWLNDLLKSELPSNLVLRLPTEAEWEKAARGEKGNEWPWGNEFDKDKCNSKEGGKGGTTPVGLYSPRGDSPYGCADMAGNVWEWTHSLYKPYPYVTDDVKGGEEVWGYRAVRGGAFNRNEYLVRCAIRDKCSPGRWDRDQGFRVVVSPVFH